MSVMVYFKLMSELKYRINSITSEHPRYPAAHLALGGEGWQSAINCEYPQAVTIQFFVPIRTRRLHLLLHQYKIPKLMEVFVKLGSRAKYRKLGHVTPNDNVQSSFEEREEKTLYFEFACTHIRLVLHENYRNDRNLFNQVALDALVVVGDNLTLKQMEGLDLAEEDTSEEEVSHSIDVSHNVRTQQDSPEHHEEDGGDISELFAPIYDKLETEKAIAVEQEDYQKAAHFKKILSAFRQQEQEIRRLEREKREALAREDYDRCHRIKTEISKKKEVVFAQRQELFLNEQQFYSQNSFPAISQREPPIQQQVRREPASPMPAHFRSPEPQPKENASRRYDEQVVPALLNKAPKSTQTLPLETNEKQRREFSADINQSIIPEAPAESDSASIKKDLQDLRELADNPAETSITSETQLAPLDNKLRLRVENYFGFIPERVWQLCVHKNWRAKVEAVRAGKERVAAVSSKQEFMGLLELVSLVVGSRQAAVSLQVIHLLSQLADLRLQFSLQHLPYFVQEILRELLNLLNDTNKQLKELAYTTYLKLPQISFLGLSLVVRQLLRHKSNVKNDPKLIMTKLQLMTALLERHPSQDFPHRDTLLWILCYFEDPNQRVRVEAADLLVAFCYIVGNEKTLKLIEVNRPQVMESVLGFMNNSIDYSKMHQEHSKLSLDNSKLDHSKLQLDNSKLHQQFYGPQIGRVPQDPPRPPSNVIQNRSQKPIFLMESLQKPRTEHSNRSRNDHANVDLSYSKESLQEAESGVKVYEEYEEEGPCSYCGEEFSDEREHYINDCKVLVFCEECSGYIYIRQFTQHLLGECENSHLFTQCKKCGLAFDLQDSNEHIGRDTCKLKKGLNWERCQFCSQDIFAEDKFWIKHAHECCHLPPRPNYRQDEPSET